MRLHLEMLLYMDYMDHAVKFFDNNIDPYCWADEGDDDEILDNLLGDNSSTSTAQRKLSSVNTSRTSPSSTANMSSRAGNKASLMDDLFGDSSNSKGDLGGAGARYV